MLSFWEDDALLRYDAIIVGGGIIGLSTAIELAERVPSMTIAVMERGVLPAGASTRNAGFACFGSLTEFLHDLRKVGEEAAVSLIDRRRRGLEILRGRLGDDAIGYEEFGGYELLPEEYAAAVDEIPRANDLLRGIFGTDLFSLRNDLIAEFGFSARHTRGLVLNPCEGQIHSGMMMRSLAEKAREHRITIITGAEVVSIEESGNGAILRAEHTPLQAPVEFHAGVAAVCTNASIPSLFPQIPIVPGRGQVVMTGPVAGLPWRGTFHIDEGFYYFRNVGERVLLGGGRNLAFEQEATVEFGHNDAILARLAELLRDLILPGREFTLERRWSGIMGFTPDKLPVVKRTSDHIVIGFGCNGMGIALAGTIARDAADLMI